MERKMKGPVTKTHDFQSSNRSAYKRDYEPLLYSFLAEVGNWTVFTLNGFDLRKNEPTGAFVQVRSIDNDNQQTPNGYVVTVIHKTNKTIVFNILRVGNNSDHEEKVALDLVIFD